MSLLGSFYCSVFRPVRRPRPTLPLRGILRWPVVFDVISFALQLRDLGRQRHIRDDYGGDGAHHKKVQDYNAGLTQRKIILTTRRAEELYEALNLPPRDCGAERLLIVGPRNVQELFTAWLFGFSWRNIEAIDLYSTNPKIQVMNMEDMSFPANQFDAVTMSNTLAYAKNTFAALENVARVLKPGGRFAFHAVYDPGAEAWPESQRTGAEIHEILRQLELSIYFHTSIDKVNSQGRLQTSHTFSCQKFDSAETPFDPFTL